MKTTPSPYRLMFSVYSTHQQIKLEKLYIETGSVTHLVSLLSGNEITSISNYADYSTRRILLLDLDKSSTPFLIYYHYGEYSYSSSIKTIETAKKISKYDCPSTHLHITCDTIHPLKITNGQLDMIIRSMLKLSS